MASMRDKLRGYIGNECDYYFGSEGEQDQMFFPSSRSESEKRVGGSYRLKEVGDDYIMIELKSYPDLKSKEASYTETMIYIKNLRVTFR